MERYRFNLLIELTEPRERHGGLQLTQMEIAVSPLDLSCAIFAIILCGIFGGVLLRSVLPRHHLAGDAKDVRLGTGLIATIGALVLGLLIASAKSSFDTKSATLSS
jgi:hypothetical protein